MSSDATEVHTRAVADKLGCESDDDAETLKCLRDVPMEKLRDAAVEGGQFSARWAVYVHPVSRWRLPPGSAIGLVQGWKVCQRSGIAENISRSVHSFHGPGIPTVFGWTQDDGATNAGPAQLIQSEDDMIPAIKRFATFLTPPDLTTLFYHYRTADCKPDVANYEARKDASDPEVSVHFFRLALILRDMLFTCSSIDFGYEMTRQTRRAEAGWSGVRLYDLNDTMLTPLLKAGGMRYAGAGDGSDTNFLFNGLFLEGTVTEEHQKLSRDFSTSLLHFAYTGNPSEEGESWPSAFRDGMILGDEVEKELNIQVVGGPHGMGPVRLRNYAANASMFEGTDQQILGEQTQYGAMHSAGYQEKKGRLEWEMLFWRCDYINSLAERLGH